ncbi:MULTISPECIES: ribosomal L7Ae/L30e/S12e/Gadd45 family protein [unclassified Gemella]|uniref:L7Ae/L30e/S12e/Gadd45 family ribosomal protein n=1 Tax=unclassified Gemella TaxID=2624949 RepID=UPI001073DAD8|nr:MULTISPECIES: ribosomal L7Ae/L30e/S12e/Gadd45 family protein [unclassified Gemella]MBF0710073.1 ribosomal L7Ae/L30e/S12e/Gadd45 family protein [Gemella sp. GL1.1]MBF0746152.1 ribosomal L7Ae/L30e/S12e/Gadd45 family protein [Gemella sp. 19428wG2_WT2a]NYS27417.1 ribosomal L7Ae/L30e/S12e/Gadd45 family protein [Gemella sp. GL1]TFU60438.1 50S ribosomal protein L7ae [Gemella sp. WT2a]
MKKSLNLLGLMTRAGKIVTGEELITKNIQESKIQLLLIATDCGNNTKKKLSDKSEYYKINKLEYFTIDEISRAIGRENRVAVGITDSGFSKRLKKLIIEEGGCIDNGKN